MKKDYKGIFLVIILFFISLLSIKSYSQKKQFQVKMVMENEITISAGSRDGVKLGFVGFTSKQVQVRGKIIQFITSRFKVIFVEEASCRARLETKSPTDPVEIGQKVTFDQEIKPPVRQTRLTIVSNPSGAAVYLDGRQRGETPLETAVSPGTYHLRLSKAGYDEINDSLIVSPDQPLRKSYTLATARMADGDIEVVTMDEFKQILPGVTVTVLRPDTGFTQTSVTDDTGMSRFIALPPGTYSVKLELMGFATIKQEGVTILPGQTAKLTMTMKQGQLTETVNVTDPVEIGQKVMFDQELKPPIRQTRLTIISNPSGAAVYLDGRQRGETPLETAVSPGTYHLRLSKAGYDEINDSLIVSPDQPFWKSYTLSPSAPENYTFFVETIPTAARVIINGSERGQSPLRVDMQEANILMRIEKENYKPVEERVILTERYTSKTVWLEQVKLSIKISSIPPGAKIYVNDQVLNDLPPDHQFDKGKYKIRIEKEGYQTLEEEIEFSSNIERTYQLAEVGYGYLIITFYPYAQVEIDGISYQEVPPALEARLPAGKHKIKFVASRLNKEKEIVVELLKDERKRIHEKIE